MKTRPGMPDDAARARALTPTSPFFKPRDRSRQLTAGRHRQARVPARQSAEGPIMPRALSGAATSRERRGPRGNPGARAAATAIP